MKLKRKIFFYYASLSSLIKQKFPIFFLSLRLLFFLPQIFFFSLTRRPAPLSPSSLKETKKEEAKLGSKMADPIPAQAPPRSATDFFLDPLDCHLLWFKPSLFLSPNFDFESYISKLRTFVPFNTLRSELKSHCAALNHKLINLINRDYADFVNLNTKLVVVVDICAVPMFFIFFFFCGCFYYYFNELYVLF